ncbi:ABC transporter permease [Acidimangrovimonas sediminis]|uniref:ABC transporter permease n=1 Tax=Acidimangrovimonas sediminis TaxID=2056283 RepID=UPI000C7FD46F|nr:iron ABC transporter permease [Acidimangrovimonas sediminis]
MTGETRRIDVALAAGGAGLLVLPWYHIRSGFWEFDWLGAFLSDDRLWPAVAQLGQGRWQLLPVLALWLVALALRLRQPSAARGKAFVVLGLAGLAWLAFEGMAIGLRGWAIPGADRLIALAGQPAWGAGAILALAMFAALFAFGLAERGVLKGDAFVLGAITALVLLVIAFVGYPLYAMFLSAFQDFRGNFTLDGVSQNIADPAIWRLDCLVGGRCGVAWRTLFLALCTASGSTLMGLVFALAATRTNTRFKAGLRLLTVLPIITPPFVIGLALIMIMGRAGFVTQGIEAITGWHLGRWIYGLPGIWLAQVLSFTPISFLVLIGVVQGVSPSMEEASQTLRSDRWRTFTKVSLPLMAPGLANAFLIGFIESMADFGNPLILGGNGGVLSTDIFFAVVGAQHNPARAAILALILLCFTLSAFLAQRFWLSGRNFSTVSGKGDGGSHARLPRGLEIAVLTLAGVWSAFTLFLYGMIFFGSFVKVWGLDNTLTLAHYHAAFGFSLAGGFTGVAWNSFWTTMGIAILAAPLTAFVGLLTAWLIVRQRFPGKALFEFAIMLSFAIPGTVIGISYVSAFNLPPLQMTGTAMILIMCFVFRNMPVGVRGGIAAMSQIDGSLDEASLMLGGSSARTLRKVILPLLRPAILAALVYSFVRAITSISAVIFLVSAQYNMATAYIVGLVENGEYGVAIAYSSVLIVVMMVVIGGFQLLVGERRIGRRDARGPATPRPVAPIKEEIAT